MKKVKLSLGAALVGMLLITFGCVKNNISGPETPPLSESEYFNFATRESVKLNVNYHSPDNKAHIEIYDENPVEVINGAYIKKNIRPVYSAFTDKDGKLVADMYIPTAVSEAYLYTNRWGLPMCVKLTATANGFEYDATKVLPAKAGTKAAGAPMACFDGKNLPYDFAEDNFLLSNNEKGLRLYSITKWDQFGQVLDLQTTSTAGNNNEAISVISKRVQDYIDGVPNKKEILLADEGEVNLQVTENDTELDLIFIAERGAFANSIGYYYYKTGNAPQSRMALWETPKYVIFPDITNDLYSPVMPAGGSVRLQFFGENYDQPATDQFPAGYTIGWFFISNGFEHEFSALNPEIGHMRNPTLNIINNQAVMFFSNDKKDDAGKDNRRFILLNDPKSGLAILGFEDQVVVNSDAEDFSDALFFVKSNKDIENPGPDVPDPETPEVKTLTLSGTVAFEDVWPYGGDYDLNDVAVEYERVISYNNNNDITKITESFTYKQAAGAAAFNNFFAIQVENEGAAQTLSDAMEYEAATKSFIITKSAKETAHPTYSVTRTFAAGTHKDVISNDFNPYIIVNQAGNSTYPKENRTEVHLPKHKATSAANPDLFGAGDEAYYMKKDGSYPFAIDITEDGNAIPFTLAKEMENIGVAYPNFNLWANSKGLEHKDWYKHPATTPQP